MPPTPSWLPSARQAAPFFWRPRPCPQCRRSFATTAAVASGHNRWSKIRHEKGAADAKKTAVRGNLSKTITLYSQMYGADLAVNPQLAAVVASAKKAAVPKAVIEAAIARGQGRSADGARLESATYEIMMPPSVALIVDLETESKARAVQDLNAFVRRRGGTVTPTKFFFARRGRVIFDETDAEDGLNPDDPITADDILEDAIEAGAEDVETDEDDGSIVVWTPPLQTGAVVNAIAASAFGDRLAVRSADTIWAVNEDTRAPLAAGHGRGDDLGRLVELVASLRAYPDVKAVYANATQGEAPAEIWQQLEQDLDW